MHVSGGTQAAAAARPMPLRPAATADDPREPLARAEALANLAVALIAQRQASAPKRLSRCEQATAWLRGIVDGLRRLPARLRASAGGAGPDTAAGRVPAARDAP